MNRTISSLVAWCVIAVGPLAGLVCAADEPAAKPSTAAQASSDKALESARLLRLSDLAGRKVNNEEGKNIGKIIDIVVDANDGQIAYAVLQFGGVLGVGEKYFAIPFGAFQEDSARKNLILNIKKERLEANRGFDKDQWPDMADEEWARDLHKHYGFDPYWDRRSDPKQTTARRPTINRQHMWVNRLNEMLGKSVKNRAGEDLGSVKDLMVDMSQGRVVYAVISDGGTLGISEKLSAVPYAALEANAEKKQFTLDSTSDRLKEIAFKESAWPNMNDIHWARKTHETFNQQPYWTVLGFGSRVDLIDRQWLDGSDYNKLYDAKRSKTVQGKVTAISEFSINNEAGRGRQIMVRTDAGESFTVHLGPVAHLNLQKLQLKEGDQVTVMGASCSFQGNDVIIAQSVRAANGDELNLRDKEGRPVWTATPSSSQFDAYWRGDSEYNKLFDPKRTKEVQGKVTAFAEFAPNQAAGRGRLIMLRTDKGEAFTIHLGPSSYLAEQQIQFKEGDQVTVTGSTATFQGADVLIAREVRTNDGKVITLRDDQGRPKWESAQPAPGK